MRELARGGVVKIQLANYSRGLSEWMHERVNLICECT